MSKKHDERLDKIYTGDIPHVEDGESLWWSVKQKNARDIDFLFITTSKGDLNVVVTRHDGRKSSSSVLLRLHCQPGELKRIGSIFKKAARDAPLLIGSFD